MQQITFLPESSIALESVFWREGVTDLPTLQVRQARALVKTKFDFLVSLAIQRWNTSGAGLTLLATNGKFQNQLVVLQHS